MAAEKLESFGGDGGQVNLCGITGFTHRNRVSNIGRIRTATDLLQHRGPDQKGTYESENVSLGAVRLKIIDLCAGAQPMFSEDTNTVLVFNGEIYNHQELRAELEAAGHHFSSHSDTEVVLQSFLRWDKECFRRLRGMFSLAIWSEREKRLLLARDRLGIKPLYIHRRGDDIYFGSELKSIFCHPEISRRLDHTALQYYLSLNYVPCPHTLVDGIEKLPPGQLLEWKDGAVRTEAYWRPRFESQRHWTMQTAEEELDRLFKASMRDHLISDVPVGVWLSGGVDSSTILHYAREATSSRLRTYSVSFRGRSFDETRYIREMASRYGTEHHEVDLNPSLDLPSAVEELTYYSDEPFADAGAVPVWFLASLSRKNVTVALSGEGADELFGGYLTYRADELAATARRIPKIMRRGLLSLVRYWPVSNDKISFEYKMKRFLEGSLLPADEAHTHWNGTFSRAQRKDLLRESYGGSVEDLFGRDLPAADSRGSLNRYLAFDQRYYLTDDILQKVDRMSMAHSLEVRPPFLDHRIVEFAASLPEHFKVDGARQKVLLKSLMKGKLPASLLRRSKTGLDIPAHDWLRGPLRPLLLETLSSQAVKETKLFQGERVQWLIREHMERRANLGYHLWGLLILFLWIKHWNIQVVPEVELTGETVEDVLTLA
ncbi:MAG TPA: asparagine synthase (glutamine-hydrolyzing) [Candidatus Acidoferrum sp.]|nr:asparagine synthase (glutamine-hydrolyzing) [Candidatus Acidoferrum sp.]